MVVAAIVATVVVGVEAATGGLRAADSQEGAANVAVGAPGPGPAGGMATVDNVSWVELFPQCVMHRTVHCERTQTIR